MKIAGLVEGKLADFQKTGDDQWRLVLTFLIGLVALKREREIAELIGDLNHLQIGPALSILKGSVVPLFVGTTFGDQALAEINKMGETETADLVGELALLCGLKLTEREWQIEVVRAEIINKPSFKIYETLIPHLDKFLEEQR